MVDFEITADAKEMPKFLYAVYLARRREGKERTQANNFGTTRDIHNRYFPQKSERDVRDICLELYRAGALLCIRGDNIFFRVRLSDAAIVYGLSVDVHRDAIALPGLPGGIRFLRLRHCRRRRHE